MKFTSCVNGIWQICLVSVSFCALAETAPRSTVPLPEWRFTLAEGGDSWAASDHNDSAWETVSLPHTWNNFDGQDGGNDYHRGTGWYRTSFQLSPAAKGQRVLVEFDAAGKVADVFVNGKAIGTHIGAFARFRFDITDAVRWGGDNLLAVRVNNSPSGIIPISGDFTQFGGLYRPARLLITAPVHIATLDHGSSGVYLKQLEVSDASAQVEATVKLANDSTTKFKGAVRIHVQDDAGKPVATAESKAELAAGQNGEIMLPVTIASPRLWNGVADPYQYQVTVEVVLGKRVLDSVVQPLGLRTIAFDPNEGFLLNGHRLELRGVNRHQDRPDKGWAISTADQDEDFALIREMGANAVRLAHYQHDQYFYDLCDAGGLVVWAEDGFVNEPPESESDRENAKEQLRELVRQNYNHPSIICWSIGNETSGNESSRVAKTVQQAQSALKLLTELAEVAKAEDSTRPSVYASHHGANDLRNQCAEILAINKYFGWYRGEYAEFGAFLDTLHANYPNLPVGVSEYGAGASIYQHEANPPSRSSQAKGPWHPEEWQNAFHEAYWLQIKERPWLWGTFIWNMFDFSNDSRTEGDQFGRNDKGLVTYDRQTRKDAFYWFQANWTTNAMVHIVSKRFWERSQSPIEAKVYSNCDQVELKVNGISLGKKAASDCRFIWPEGALNPGPNRIEAYAYRQGRVVAADWGGWTYRADGDPLPNKPIAEQDRQPTK